MNADTVLIVDDESPIRDLLVVALKRPEVEILEAGSAAEGRDLLKSGSPGVILLDIGLPDSSGLELLSEFLADDPARMVIMLTGRAEEEMVIGAMQRGAMDYVTKPFKVADVRAKVDKARDIARRNQACGETESKDSEETHAGVVEKYLAGKAPAMLELFKLIGKLARSSVPVMITGESGTGKELVARALHRHGMNSSGPFVPVDCGSIPGGLLEAELFGYERGAFTGAVAAKPGRFESAHGGTLFLDEIGNIPLEVQANLLRAVQEKTSQRLGSNRTVAWDARIVSATNADVKGMVGEGKFREDLLYRLAGVQLRVPPLRERIEDLPLLLDHFLGKWRAQRGQLRVAPEALEKMSGYPWPGNVRELEHVVDRAVALARGAVIGLEDLPRDIREGGTKEFYSEVFSGGKDRILNLEELKRRYARHTLEACGGNKTEAARLLDIHRKTLNVLLGEKAGPGEG